MEIQWYIGLAAALFCIGIVGVLTRRNSIIIFMCIELMFNAVNLLLVAFSKMHAASAAVQSNPSVVSDAQIFVFFIMVVAAAEVSVGLAIIVMLYRNTHSVDVNFLNRLKN
ncbi:MAG TPA: NADH-quinone oxidoreductase subunit NuoK [Ferruginibacter sp.]|nr:NADH-quinone oxidoreductase subunit NuoK [Chitinophagaceae bacterium]MBK8495906.1 NADH-quinone oxidoreductase subunit NuoK [Chitinophagaceae bacterium]HQW93350.1 NADH-quinone oxidoreductase subunit NuoK [Ferruginibacter sp.]